jgi:glycosyltransferase involved in cell wall biosynthesis
LKPKVLILIDTAITGGPGKGLFQLLKHAPAGEFEYVLCNFHYRKPRSKEFINEARSLGLNLHLLSQHFRFDPSPLWQAACLLRSTHCNLLQTHGYKGHLIALILAKILRVPWIAFEHGLTAEDWKIRIYQRAQLWALKYADMAVAVSPPLYRTVSSLRGAKRPTALILNAIDPQELKGTVGGKALRLQLGLPDDDIVLGVFGRLSPEKGHHLLLQAFSEVLRARPKAFLLIVGDGQERARLVRQAEELGIAPRVRFAGHQTGLRDYYEASNLMVLPSLSEGLPNVLLEAMSLGLPAVATNVGAVREVICDGQNGWIVPPGTAAGLAEVIKRVLSEPNTLAMVGERARQSLFPKFSAAARASSILELYQRVLQAA